MDVVVKLLESHEGRDKVMRAVGYCFLYLGSNNDNADRGSSRASRNFLTISRELSYCRMILRLFDDLPMLKYTLSYGLGGRQDKDIFLRILGVLKNIVDQIYFPVEHVAWAAEKKFLNASSSLWYTVGAFLWGLSSYISIIRSLIKVSILQKKTYGLKNLSMHENIVKEQLEHMLSIVKNAADAAMAINYLPVGSMLWAGKLNSNQIGYLGVISSVLGLILMIRNLEKA